MAVLGGACLLFFWPLLTPDPAGRMYIVDGDFTRQFYPYHYFAAAEWWAGRIPLWNPYMFGGHPFQADIQTAVFYPLALVVNLLGGRDGLPLQALELQGIANYLLAALFSYLFLRTTVGDRLAALLGALCFALGGYLTSYPFQQLAVLETAIWLPLVLLLLEVGVRRPDKLLVWWLGAGLAMAVSILAGHPQSALFVGYTALAYLLFRGWSARLPWRKVAGGAVGFGLAAAGGAAVQLLPTAEFTALSTRAAIPYDIAASGYDYVALPGLLMPGWRNEKALYLGAAPLLLAMLALRRGPRHSVWFWGMVAIVALTLSFGDRGLLYRLFHAVAPGFATFKGQERTAFVFSFAGAVLAAQGLAALRARRVPNGGRGLALAAGILAAVAAAGALAFWPQNDVVAGTPDLASVGYPRLLALLAVAGALCWLAGRGGGGEGSDAPARVKTAAAVGEEEILRRRGQNAMRATVRLTRVAFSILVARQLAAPSRMRMAAQVDAPSRFFACGLRMTVRRLLDSMTIFRSGTGTGTSGARLAGAAALLLVAVAGADVLAANWQSNMAPVNPAISEAQAAVVRFLKEQEKREGEPLRVRPQSDAALPANHGAIAGLPFAAGDSPLVVQRSEDLFASPQEWRLWQLLNVKYAVRHGPPNEALEEVFAAPPLAVYRNRFSLPRAWVVEDVRVAAGPAEAREAILAPDLHPGRTAVVEEPLAIRPRPAAEGEAPLEQQIAFDYYSPRRLYLHTRTNRDGLLVLSEVFYPGWQAKLDGRPVPIHRADYILRGIALPAGEHRLEMVYNPPSFWLGLAISAATVAGVLAVWLWSWRRSTRREGKAG